MNRYRWYPFDADITIVVVALCLMLGVAAFAIQRVDQSLQAQCAEIMRHARTSRDSLDAQVACAKLGSDAATAVAISGAAGVVAGMGASRR